MKKYQIPVEWIVYGDVEVEAENIEDLKNKLNNKDFVDKIEKPIRFDYLEDSLKVADWESIEEIDDEDYLPF